MSRSEHHESPAPSPGRLSRREVMAYTAAFGSTFLAAQGLAAAGPGATDQPLPAPVAPGKKYDMKKSINLWALPYPAKMSLQECFEICADAGFDGVEVNFALDGDLTPQTSDADVQAVGQMARRLGLQISGLCSFLFWPYSLTHEDPKRREEALELATKMIHTAALLGTENLLVIAGAVYIPWL